MASTLASAMMLRRKLCIVTGAAMAVSLLVVAYSTEPRRSLELTQLGDQSELASWATANGLTGLSPASLAPVPDRSASVDQSGIASWATANGLTGLSPSSLTPAPARPASVDQSDIASWATANGLTGLSPASLSGCAPGRMDTSRLGGAHRSGASGQPSSERSGIDVPSGCRAG